MATKSRSLPANGQLESSFQKSMDSRMPLTRPDSPDTDLINHDYASPLELKIGLEELEERRANGHKKKTCAVYEPTETKRKLSDEDDAGGVRIVHRHDKLFRILFSVLFVLVIISICISLLSIAGFKLGKNSVSCDCSKSSVPPAFSAVTKDNESTPAVAESVFEKRLKSLEETLVPSLMQKIADLEQKLNETAAKTVVGPQGPIGLQGPPGPKGDIGPAGQSNMKSCRARTSSVTSHLAVPYARIFATTDHVGASAGHVMLSATCSAFGAAEYSLFTDKSTNTTTYYCTCAGKAETEALSPSPQKLELECRITWWECPLL